jgi:DNA-binding NtrC family response regulator
MSLSAQAKVLRALQENKIMRVGGEKDIKVNVRVLAATNKIIPEEIENGNFREDLYHRLSVILLSVPPLDKRKDDIPLLVSHFSAQICKEYGIGIKSFAKEALDALKKLSWAGNIRELRNVVERLIILGGEEVSAKEVRSFVKPLNDQ